MKRAGNCSDPLARETVISPSSSGWRRFSRTERENSANSSRKSTPRCARLISPGFGNVPPPTSDIALAVWCGARNGRVIMSALSLGNRPAIENILVISKLSSRSNLGRIVGNVFARSVFPDPGGPIKSVLCPPAAAISSARVQRPAGRVEGTFLSPITTLVLKVTPSASIWATRRSTSVFSILKSGIP